MIYRFFSSVESGASSVVSDRLDAHSYFVPFSCRKYCETADFYKERAFSDRIVSLNGDWNFAFFPNGIKDEFHSDTDFSTVISVPSSWESGGFLPVRFFTVRAAYAAPSSCSEAFFYEACNHPVFCHGAYPAGFRRYGRLEPANGMAGRHGLLRWFKRPGLGPGPRSRPGGRRTH